MQQTRTIPIVFAQAIDPVGSGFVASFPQPGGNVTGFISMEPTLASKWLELLKEVAPHVNRVAILFNPITATYAEYFLNPFKAAAAHFNVEAITAPVRDTSEFASVIAAQARAPNGGLRDAGYLYECPSRGDYIAGGSLPSTGRLSISYLR
ncbi:hypothetical protein JQ611_26555 [Bradyrhizobium sp. AUGA SZCCT0182]|nr:hypothetical protein [Bradyrhizobium sp. AUGA SZCCT0182]